MKKLVLSLIALASLSGVSFASQRGYDLRDVQPFNGTAVAASELKPLAAPNSGAAPSNFERLNVNAAGNLQGGH